MYNLTLKASDGSELAQLECYGRSKYFLTVSMIRAGLVNSLYLNYYTPAYITEDRTYTYLNGKLMSIASNFAMKSIVCNMYGNNFIIIVCAWNLKKWLCISRFIFKKILQLTRMHLIFHCKELVSVAFDCFFSLCRQRGE